MVRFFLAEAWVLVPVMFQFLLSIILVAVGWFEERWVDAASGYGCIHVHFCS